MKFKVLILVLAAVFLFSCENSGKKEDKAGKEKIVKPQWADKKVTAGGFFLNIPVPLPQVIKGEIRVSYLEDRGILDVNGGENFDYFIFEDGPGLQNALDELKNHPFYKTEIVEKTNNSILYRQYLETGGKEKWGFYAEKTAANANLTGRSNPEKNFNEFYARKMLESFNKITPLKK